MSDPSAAAYRAAWLFPVSGSPLRNAILEVDDSGRISDIRTGRDGVAIDFGDAAIVPALVNAHIHLEFSDLTSPIAPTSPFSSWVRNVVGHRRSRTDPIEKILARGLGEARRTGTVAAGEIATQDADQYRDAPIELTLFREVIGPLQQHWPALLAHAEQHVSSPSPNAPRLRPGLSPHAPHTVPQELFERIIDLAERHAAPVAVHLAETSDELSLLRDGRGDLVAMMTSLGLWEATLHPTKRRPLGWLRELVRVPHGLVIHGNYLAADELDFIAAHSNLSLVYCPRTHEYFGHPPHPFRRVLDQGGRVALGTDGRSSNPDLDLWREAEYVSRKHPDLSSVTILELVTKAAAEALGIGERHGVLRVGRQANFLVVPLESEAKGDDPPNLFATDCKAIRVFQDGIEIVRCDGDHHAESDA